jgi:hypothetical protein
MPQDFIYWFLLAIALFVWVLFFRRSFIPRYSKEKSEEFIEAARRGNFQKIKLLSVDPEVDLNYQRKNSRYGETAFYNACWMGYVEIARYLLNFKERPIYYNQPARATETPFYMACERGREKIVKLLVQDKRIDINRARYENETPIWIACYFGNLETVKSILASGRSINLQNKDDYYYCTAKWIPDATHQRTVELHNLMSEYQADPQSTRLRLQREQYNNKEMAGELFSLVVYLSDDYFKLKEGKEKEKRFFKIATRLPMDLQMVLCNKVFWIDSPIIKKIHSEQGFKVFAQQ